MMSAPGAGGGRRRSRGLPMSEINVTPLVDVMLVLLIIFMITAPLLVAGVPLELPQTRAKALPNPEKPVTVSIDAQGQVFLDDELVPADRLPTRLEAIASTQADKRILFRADRAVDYGQALGVLGELANAGLTKVSLVSQAANRAPGEAAEQ